MALHLRRWPRPQGSPTGRHRLVLLHGFTQNSRCWGHFGDELARSHPVDAIDAPGHGHSGHDDADLWQSADLITDALNRDDSDRPILVGYSMGGRMALHVALAHPTSMAGLVLIGATAGIEEPDQRQGRRAADEAIARRLESEPLPEFLAWWMSNPLFAGLSADAGCLAERLVNRPRGLAANLRHCGTGSQEPLWKRLSEISVPVLLLTGSNDGKFTDLSQRMARSLTAARVERRAVDGTHAIHMEQPVPAAAAVHDFVEHQVGPGA